jgi:hypothetical protein
LTFYQTINPNRKITFDGVYGESQEKLAPGNMMFLTQKNQVQF